MADKSTSVATTERIITNDNLRDIKSMEDAIALLDGQVDNSADVIGTGADILSGADKDKLLGIPFLAISWSFNLGDFGPFVSINVITDKGDKYVINDGSTGIRDQLVAFTDQSGRQTGLLCRKGLRKSEYDNEHGHGVTYYIS